MKKLLILAVLLVISYAQAETKRWLCGLYGSPGVSNNWTDLSAWYSNEIGSFATNLPVATDTVQIDGLFAAQQPANMPIINSDAGTITMLMFGMNEGGTATLTITNDGQISVSSLTRLGHLGDSTGVVTMIAGYMHGGAGQIGYQEAGYPITGGDGIINLSGSSTQRFSSLEFGQDQPAYLETPTEDGRGVIHMSDTAVLIVDGDMITSGSSTNWIINGAIDANGEVGKGIIANYNSGEDWTEFTVVPEPAILGLLAILGLAFLRRK